MRGADRSSDALASPAATPASTIRTAPANSGGAPISRLRGPDRSTAHEPRPTGPSTGSLGGGRDHHLPVDNQVSHTDRDWRHDRDHGGRDNNWHGGDHHDNNWSGRHDDHPWDNWNDHHWNGGHRSDWYWRSYHRPSVFYISPYFYNDFVWSPTLSTVSLSWSSGNHWYTSLSFGASYCDPYWNRDPLCITPSIYHRHYRYYYEPLTYSLTYPTVAYSYPTYLADSYPSTNVYNYYTSYDTSSSSYDTSSGGLIGSAQAASPGAYTSSGAADYLGGQYVNNGLLINPASPSAAVGGVAPAPAVTPAPAPAEADAVTLYRASRDNGQLAWSDSAATIVNAVLMADNRAAAAQRYLGKSLSGGWEATLESKQVLGSVTELTCRGTVASGTGTRPTIIVRVPRIVTGIEPGQRVAITGRITELSVNDPENAGGYLMLDSADVSW